jgi:hypothetical protein
MLSTGHILHYQKRKTSLPLNSDFGQPDHFLLTVISLKRNILLNFEKLSRLATLCDRDSLQYLTSPKNNMYYREDSVSEDSEEEKDSDQEDSNKEK